MYATARRFIVVGKGYELETDNGKTGARAMVLRSLLDKVVLLELPAGTELRADEGIGLGAVDGTIGGGIPKDFFPSTEGELTDEEALGEVSSVVEVRLGWWSTFAGESPFGMVVGGAWQSCWGRLVADELLVGK